MSLEADEGSVVRLVMKFVSLSGKRPWTRVSWIAGLVTRVEASWKAEEGAAEVTTERSFLRKEFWRSE